MAKSHVIYNGFDFARLDAKPFDETSLRKELGLVDKRVVTMVARFDRAKNPSKKLLAAETGYVVNGVASNIIPNGAPANCSINNRVYHAFRHDKKVGIV